MDLILEKKNVFANALSDWQLKWLPAVIEYTKSLCGKKKEIISSAEVENEGIFDIIQNNVLTQLSIIIGNPGEKDHLVMNMLFQLFSKKGAENNLIYLYEENEVQNYC